MVNAVELTRVTKRFGRHAAVDGLELGIPTGAIYGFIGPNGSGKTTTLRLILRIFQPDEGRVVVLGADHGSVADDRVGYLPEERGLYKRMKVMSLLTYFAELKGLSHCRQEIRQWLRRLDAEDWATKKIESLSKGMSQKIQFIAAVLARPKLLILDEPFSGLDPVNLETLKRAIMDLRERGTTIIFSTHDMNAAEQVCDTVLMIFRGKKVLDGTIESIQRRYPVNTVRVRLIGDAAMPEDLEGVERCDRKGSFLHVRLASEVPPDRFLKSLAAKTSVEHFEIVRPTLHDIFVDIARPDAHQESTAP